MQKKENGENIISDNILDNVSETYISKVTIRSKIIYWTILGMLLIGIISMFFINVDVSIQSSGVLQSKVARQRVYSFFTGVVTRANIENETPINKGDTLLIVSTDAQVAKEKALTFKIDELNLRFHDLGLLLEIDSTKIFCTSLHLTSKMYSSEYRLFIDRYVQQFRHVVQAEREYQRDLTLFKQKVIANAEFEENRQKYLDEQENLRLTLQKQLSKWNEDLVSIVQDSKQSNADLCAIQHEISNSVVTAPISGVIQNSIDIQQGGMVMANQLLGEITPDSLLVAIVYVKPSDIGYLKVGLMAKLQVDAFNYNQWGILEAHVNEISSDVYTDNSNNIFFKVTLSLSRDFMKLTNGYTAKLRKGMTVNAHILITQRTLLNLIYDKADSWFNPYQTTNK